MLAYRHERFLAQAIEGVIAQKCPFPFELIVAEDCSPDSTLVIALAYQKRFPEIIRVIHGKRNVGMHQNLTQSMPYCRGKYVASCEGDDYWHDISKLADQIAALESDPNMTLCHSDFDRLTRLKRTRSVHRTNLKINRPAFGYAYNDLVRTWSIMTATSVYRREVVLAFFQSPFYRTEWPFGDINLQLFASLHGTIGYIDRSTATFRKMRGSAGNRGFEAALRARQADLECVQMFLSHYPAPNDITREAIAIRRRKVYIAAYYAARADILNECFKCLEDNEYCIPSSMHHIKMLAIKLRLPLLVELKIRNFIINHLSSIPT